MLCRRIFPLYRLIFHRTFPLFWSESQKFCLCFFVLPLEISRDWTLSFFSSHPRRERTEGGTRSGKLINQSDPGPNQ